MSTELLLGSAATVLRRDVPDASIDMIYSDPPFGNEQIWTGAAGSFSDKWAWGPESSAGWLALRQHNAAGADLVAVIAANTKARAYLGMMAGLLLECRRVLKPTGTLWLHFDDTMGAHLRVLGDVVFGIEQQLGTVIWRRSRGGKSSARSWGRNHDTIACFARTRVARWRLARCRGEFTFGDPLCRVGIDGIADDQLTATARERVGYPTQKPVSLLERFIRSATLPGDVVLDPTCGSGTTLVAAAGLRRRGIGIDISEDALAAARERLRPPTVEQLDLFGVAA